MFAFSKKKRNQCQAYVLSTGSRCSKASLTGSRYCWAHQSTVSLLMSALIGAIVSIAVGEGWRYIVPSSESVELAQLKGLATRKASFKTYLNDVEVPTRSVVLIPSNGKTQALRFDVQNVGSVPATGIFVCLVYPAGLKALRHEGWRKEDAPGIFHEGHIIKQEHLGHIVYESKNLIDIDTGLRLPPLLIEKHITSPLSIPVILTVSSPQAEMSVTSIELLLKPSKGSVRIVGSIEREQLIPHLDQRKGN